MGAGGGKEMIGAGSTGDAPSISATEVRPHTPREVSRDNQHNNNANDSNARHSHHSNATPAAASTLPPPPLAAETSHYETDAGDDSRNRPNDKSSTQIPGNFNPLHSSNLRSPEGKRTPLRLVEQNTELLLVSPNGLPPAPPEVSMDTLPPSAAFLNKYSGGAARRMSGAKPKKDNRKDSDASAASNISNISNIHNTNTNNNNNNTSDNEMQSNTSLSLSPSVSNSPPPCDGIVGEQSADKATAAATACAGSRQKYYYSNYRAPCRSVSPAPLLSQQYSTLDLDRVQDMLSSKHKIVKVVLTGGPCAGKSTLLTRIMEEVPKRSDFLVFTVPEAATLFISCGMRWDANLVVYQQHLLLEMQLRLEDTLYKLAEATNKNVLLLCDRGAMDGRAFCSPEEFDKVLELLSSETAGDDSKITIEMLRDRYDGVLHMVTAAIGAEEFYNNDNNPARYENLEQAKASDLKLRKTYVGHPCFRLLENYAGESFDDKIERGVQTILDMMGVDTNTASSYGSAYFLLRPAAGLNRDDSSTLDGSAIAAGAAGAEREVEAGGEEDAGSLTVGNVIPADVTTAKYRITTVVLSNSEINEIRLAIRRQNRNDMSCVYFFKSIKNYNSSDKKKKVEKQQRISSKEYKSLLLYKDNSREAVVIEAINFMYGNSNYEYNRFLAPVWVRGKETLKVEYPCSSSSSSVGAGRGKDGGGTTSLELPDFVTVDREVPMEREITAFLVSHRETGGVYTSLAFAPVFSQASGRFIHRAGSGGLGKVIQVRRGSHADVQDILCSTKSNSPLRLTNANNGNNSSINAVPVVSGGDAGNGTARRLLDVDENENENEDEETDKEDGSAIVSTNNSGEVTARVVAGAEEPVDAEEATHDDSSKIPAKEEINDPKAGEPKNDREGEAEDGSTASISATGNRGADGDVSDADGAGDKADDHNNTRTGEAEEAPAMSPKTPPRASKHNFDLNHKRVAAAAATDAPVAGGTVKVVKGLRNRADVNVVPDVGSVAKRVEDSDVSLEGHDEHDKKNDVRLDPFTTVLPKIHKTPKRKAASSAFNRSNVESTDVSLLSP